MIKYCFKYCLVSSILLSCGVSGAVAQRHGRTDAIQDYMRGEPSHPSSFWR